ncbi:short-chain dehydrogenase [Cercophora newfieldiana]|uniref:Short-chain dehydrogenase n=1 Tax=Cercophora newfieldiana TaxID=92897 RepID=A0AA39YEA5_9PEZI|nr:short-chain dehydrogenase [Cercophora newfieldiana]
MPSTPKLTVLITACSPGGMGAALATTLHKAGHRVFATARNVSKLSPLAEQGIETLALDVTSASSIAAAFSAVSSALSATGPGLNILVNNAAGSYTMPVVDASLDEARALFDVNVWSHIAVTQAFLPLLLRPTAPSASAEPHHPAKAMIVNHTSVGSRAALPFQGIYNASKAALAMLTETMRLELAAFGIRVIDLKTAGVHTNIIANNNVNAKSARLPAGSIYEPARKVVEEAMSQEGLKDRGIPPEQWAAEVTTVLLGKNPPAVIWKGEGASLARLGVGIPGNMFEGMIKKMTKLDVVEQIIKESRSATVDTKV